MLRQFRFLALAATAMVGLASAAAAADLSSPAKPKPAPAVIQPWNPWLIRVRALGVVPNDGSKVYAAGARIAGSKTDISNTVVPELDISYFFTPNLAAELILATTPHSAKGDGTLAGLGTLGRVWVLPPTLTFQYHFTNFGAFKPYVGAGVNYTFFYGESDRQLTRFKVSNAPGAALQVGFDYMLDQHWGLNVDVKKLFIRPDAKGFLGAAPIKAKLELDPWLFGAGVTYKF